MAETRSVSARWSPIIWGAVLPILLVASWQLITFLHVVPAYRLPSPSEVFLAETDLSQRGLLWNDIAISTQRVLLGFVFGSILGLALGLGLVLGALVGLSSRGSRLLAPTVGAFRAVPSLAWVPQLILYLGINEDEKVILHHHRSLLPGL